MRVAARVTVSRKGEGIDKRADRILRSLRGPKAVKVGYPKGKVGQDILSIAVWNHYGTSRGIPARPFLALAMFKGRAQIRQNLRALALSVVRGRYDLRTGLQRLGIYGQGLAQKQIAANTPPPNHPKTTARKRSSKTLIDTGRLRQATTWDYDK